MSFQVKYIYDLVDKISPQLQKVKKNLKSTQDTVRKVATNSSRNFDRMKNSLNNVGNKAKEVGKSLFLRVTLPVTALGAAFVKAASDAEETSSKFATVFSSISKEADQTANNLAKNFGLSSIKAKELLGDTGDLLTGFGFSGKAALDLARETNKLAVDLASFTNFSGGAEGASKALTKALLGERESVKSLGISILEEDVKSKVKSLAATGKLTGMTMRQAKAYATLQIAIGQSKNAIGDYARTSESFANKTRVLSARFQDFRIILGNILLPLALKLVNITIKLIEKFNKLSPTTKKIILIVAGLAAVLSPLLITIGFMIPAITALIPVISALGGALAFLALNPIGLVIAGIAALLIASKDFRKDFMAVLNFVGGAFIDFWDSMRKPIESFIEFFTDKVGFIFNSVRKLGNFGAGLFGADSDPNSQQINRTLSTNINANQSPIPIGGSLGIDIRGLPTGSSTNFTPAPGNKLPVGLSSSFITP